MWDARVMDKPLLIIEIFKQRARTMEGKLQVELADLKYNLSSHSGYGRTLDQQYGVIGTRGGSGEKKIEYDRRKLRERISLISKEVEKIRTNREIKREKRLSIPLPVISIVGYTNAGKSTLINSLSGRNDVYADNKLFATLDPTSRRVKINRSFFAVFTDTVGFIDNLPHLLIISFSPTLEEIRYSDLIIHLHDITADITKHNEVVKKTLSEIGATDIPLINVFNKTDLTDDILSIKEKFAWLDPVFISASEKTGLDKLLLKVDEKLKYRWKDYVIKISNSDINTVNLIRKKFFIVNEEYKNNYAVFSIKSTEENMKRMENILSITVLSR
jgi:GTP-binding protein HflX